MAQPKQMTPRRGFTILEVLIALTASLLLMLSLTKAFKLIGDQITDSQAEVQLSSTLRDSTFRLRTELRSATSSMVPAGVSPGEPTTTDGYLTYHEGPFTDLTTILGDISPAGLARDPNYFPESRYGDIDDFLSFTARADENSPFVGVIPWGVLEAKRRYEMLTAGQTYTLPAGYDPTRLVPFTSTIAEIAYFLSPEWQRKADGTVLYDPDNGYPLFVDADEDLLPDRFNLHRRVLLIRGDLGLTRTQMNAVGTIQTPYDEIPQLPYLLNSGGNGQIVPLIDNNGNARMFVQANNALRIPGNPFANKTDYSPSWLAGLGNLQQVMDLSISRVVDVDGNNTNLGQPTLMVRANSLADVSQPENRFGVVRPPRSFQNNVDTATFMPMLSLCPPHPYLSATNRDTIFPTPANRNPNSTGPAIGADERYRYGRFTLKSYLRPEFALSDAVHHDARQIPGMGNNLRAYRTGRGGDDIIARDVLAFDVRIFDPLAPIYTGVGPDGEPGQIGDDDNINNPQPDFGELGWANSDDVRIRVSDPLIREVMRSDPYTGANGQTMQYELTDRGDFVDLNYARLQGGPMMGVHVDTSNGNTPPTGPSIVRTQDLITRFSGVEPVPGGVGPTEWVMPTPFQRSGRIVPSNTLFQQGYFQSVYDTWSNHYATDLFNQEGYEPRMNRLTFFHPTHRRQLIEYQTNYGGGVFSYFEPTMVVVWDNQTVESNYQPFATVPTINYSPAPFDRLTKNSTSTFTDQPFGISPPFPDPLEALSISVRVFDATAGQLRQQTIVEYFAH